MNSASEKSQKQLEEQLQKQLREQPGPPDLNLATAWEAVADHIGDEPALQHGGLKRTWVEFEDRAARLAGALSSAGVGAGDNVALALYNGNEYLEAEFAAFKLRAGPCNVNYRYVEGELAYLIDNSDAKAVFFDHGLADRMAAIRARLPQVRLWIEVGSPTLSSSALAESVVGYEDLISSHQPAGRLSRSGDDLWILYTGGTTGNPKGVMWPHASLVELVERSLQPLGIPLPRSASEMGPMLDRLRDLDALPRLLAAAPLMHGTSGISALFTLFRGGQVVTLTDRHFDPVELWRCVESVQATAIALVGDVFCRPMVDALDEAEHRGNPYQIASLKQVTSSGVMWSKPVKDRLLGHAARAGASLILNDSLGASEGVGFAARQSVGDGDTETASFALGPNAALFSDDGRRIEPGSSEVGLLAVSGPIPVGYYGDPVKTDQTYKQYEGRRWAIPGDWATLAADGTVTLLGRGSVSINTGGEKVFPEEVEEALKRRPEVADAVVVGVPDPVWGAAVTAVIQLGDTGHGEEVIDDRQLIDSLRSDLSGYKLPKNLIRVDEVFRGPNGKADYKWAVATAKVALGIDDAPDS